MPEQPIDPKRLKTLRDNVIRYVYEHGAGKYAWGVKRDQVKSALGITEHDLQRAYMVMREQGLTPDYGLLSDVGLNQRGQEEAVRLGTATAMHEPAMPSQITIEAHYSIVQVAGANSTQSAQLTVDQSKVSQVIAEIERELPTLNLQKAERSEASDLLAHLKKLIAENVIGAATRAIGAALAAIIKVGGSKLGEVLMDHLHIGIAAGTISV
ncbi:hypothetical protein HU675_0027905 [Bradyrhizobium septentrionale]|uniref:hypothetical protein n=1 Tax=Bradyrhizobium septentrionale TaxID=1404411 RepID=UPI001596B4A8|nr:hypothetical protein [Bradyrhizobium septentrionale]UGY21832.1 hypothetical protein HU675_0027905 [Bradyrhizobium septentrionale]